jgi:hypothetical protein
LGFGRAAAAWANDALYELAFCTARAFERFKGIYHTYLDDVSRARS